ncbi:hypothetical protein [Bdellovibrio sp. HCB2-146]|uniref:hypothetical protein n=1 Tax=Bdellovibrio sp. HCB2-146 TaxID=3394362 RepID=UPI0039BC92DC
MMLNKHTLIMTALMASLSLTACGKKTDVVTPPPAEPQKQAGPCTDNCKDEGTSGDLGGGVPDENDESVEPPTPVPNEPAPQEPKPTSPKPGSAKPAPAKPAPAKPAPAKPAPAQPVPAPAKPAPAKPAQPNYPQPPAVEKVPTTPSITDVMPTPTGSANELPSDYRPNDVTNVTRDGVSKRLTGGVTKEGYVYTSTSTDELLNYLRARNERVGYESRQQNLAAAASIVSAKISNDGFSGESAVITLKVQESGGIKVYNLEGTMAEGPASTLYAVRGGNGLPTTGARPIKGTLKCVDLDGGCETSFARVEIGAKGSSGIVYVVFRSSKADLYFHLPAKADYSGNPEFYSISDYIVSTIGDKRTNEKIKTRSFKSWEVVNGRSGFIFSTKGYNNELLAFAGPLLSQEGGTAINVPLNRIGKDEDNSLDLLAIGSSKLNYANSIGEARLIANNGLGQIRLGFKMRKRNNYAQDRWAVTVMRVIKPIVDLDDDNLK